METPKPRTILWVDASSFNDGAATGIAVADTKGVIVSSTSLYGRWSSSQAEAEAIRVAIRCARWLHLPFPLEIRCDCMTAVKQFATPPKGVSVVHGYRGDNTAHDEAQRRAHQARSHSLV